MAKIFCNSGRLLACSEAGIDLCYSGRNDSCDRSCPWARRQRSTRPGSAWNRPGSAAPFVRTTGVFIPLWREYVTSVDHLAEQVGWESVGGTGSRRLGRSPRLRDSGLWPRAPTRTYRRTRPWG